MSSASRTTNVPLARTCSIPAGGLRGRLEGCVVDDRGWVEDRDVGVRPDADPALGRHLRHVPLEPLRRHQRHLSERNHEREEAFLAHVAAENASEGAGSAWMAVAVQERDAVARHHHERMGQHSP